MSKPKAKTLIDQMGFSDDGLTTPLHDEIMIWINEHVEHVLRSTVYTDDDWSQPQLNFASNGEGEIPPCPPWSDFTIEWEVPIRNNRGFEIGFVDAMLRARTPVLTIGYKKKIGFSYVKSEFAVEVKPKIESCGELLRQLSLYRSYLQSTSIIVVSPDDRFASIVREQKHFFMKYERTLPTE